MLGRIISRIKISGRESQWLYRSLSRQYTNETCATSRAIGVVGVGMVGSAVIDILQRQEINVSSIYDIDGSKCERFSDCHIANSSREVVENSDVIITALPKPVDVKIAFEGDNGLLKGKFAYLEYDLTYLLRTFLSNSTYRESIFFSYQSISFFHHCPNYKLAIRASFFQLTF